MTKKQLLEMVKLLSALESWGYSSQHPIPGYLQEWLDRAIDGLTAEILNGATQREL